MRYFLFLLNPKKGEIIKFRHCCRHRIVISTRTHRFSTMKRLFYSMQYNGTAQFILYLWKTRSGKWQKVYTKWILFLYFPCSCKSLVVLFSSSCVFVRSYFSGPTTIHELFIILLCMHGFMVASYRIVSHTHADIHILFRIIYCFMSIKNKQFVFDLANIVTYTHYQHQAHNRTR